MATASKSKAGSSPNLPSTQIFANDDEFTAALREAGFLSAASGGSEINRVRISGTTVYYGDEILGVANPKTKEPALYVQLTDEPRQFQRFFFPKPGEPGSELAEIAGRPHIAGKFCKSWFDNPSQARKYSEDGASCDACPVHPFMPKDQLPPEADGKKCQWSAEVEFRILERQDDGTFVCNDETIYTLTLATTGVIEYFGSGTKGRDPQAGSVSEKNTQTEIAMLGIAKWGKEGLFKARTFARLGGIIHALHILPARSKDGKINWTVPHFTPIDILEVEEPNLLPDSSAEATNGDVSTEDIPF